MRCKQCGADNPADSKFCAYCGSPFPLNSVEQEKLSREAKFDQVEASAAFKKKDTAARVKQIPVHALAILGPLVFGVFFLGIAGFISLQFLRAGGFMIVVPLLIMAAGLFAVMKNLTKMISLQTAPLKSFAAEVISKRISMSGGGKNSSVKTHYHVTWEDRQGRRKEYELLDQKLYGQLAEEDMGVVFVKSDFALDFDRVQT